MEETLRVHCVTWNVGTFAASAADEVSLRKVLGLENRRKDNSGEPLPHVYAVGFQEVHARVDKFIFDALVHGDDEWTRSFTSFLSGLNYVRLRSYRLVGIVLNIFVHRNWLTRVRDFGTQYLRLTGGGLKGAVCVRLQLLGVSMCFVNCHLSAHDENNSKRIAEYSKIVEGVTFDKYRETSNILYHDYIFWLGDLNFRLDNPSELPFDDIVRRIDTREWRSLLVEDQLRKAMDSQVAFSELSEGELSFPPTFKLSTETNVYDGKRRPAWTDRILFRCNSENYDDFPLRLSQVEYLGHSTCFGSDHRPVTSAFEARAFGAGQADTRGIVAYHSIVTFRKPEDWRVGVDGNVIYAVELGSMKYLNTWDWIGLFKADFASLDSFVAFAWASQCRRQDVDKAVVISENLITSPGLYQLVYIGERGCILGTSQVFEINP